MNRHSFAVPGCLLIAVASLLDFGHQRARAQETGLNNVLFRDTFQGDFVVAGSSTRVTGAADPQSSNPFNLSVTLPNANDTVYAAFIDWSFLTDNPNTATLNTISLNNTAVTATGSAISSGSPDLGWSYRYGAAYVANVTAIAQAAKTGATLNFSIGNASDKAGSLGEGLSLIVLYRDNSMPTREINVYSGYTSGASGNGLATFGFGHAYSNGTAHFFLNGIDGQQGYGDSFQINGTNATGGPISGLGTANDAWQGRVGPGGVASANDLYDQAVGNAQSFMTNGEMSLTAQTWGAGNGTNLTDFVGNSFGAMSFAASPEPSALAIFAVGILGLVTVQWMRRRHLTNRPIAVTGRLAVTGEPVPSNELPPEVRRNPVGQEVLP